MRIFYYFIFVLCGCLINSSCKKGDPPVSELLLNAVYIGIQEIPVSNQVTPDIPVDRPLEMIFSAPVDAATAMNAIALRKDGLPVEVQLQVINDDQNVKLTPQSPLTYNTTYTLAITSALKGRDGGTFPGAQLNFQTVNGTIRVTSITIDGQPGNLFSPLTGISLEPGIEVKFSGAVDTNQIRNYLELSGAAAAPSSNYQVSEDLKMVGVNFTSPLADWTKYTFAIKEGLKGKNGEDLEETSLAFYTKVDETPKFPAVSDDELLTLIQEQTFGYFWEFGHPVSGLARERNTSNETVTFGGSGFGLMAMVAAVERGFITFGEALARWEQIIGFLQTADRFHGAFPHWMNGTTGKVQPFSERDNGADLVETAFFIQGLLTVRQYLLREAPQETELIRQINDIWEGVEWDWFTKGEDQGLYWHWSPDREWAINLKIQGHNETQIIYVLAAASSTHGISKEIYTNGYARSGQMSNGKSFYGITLPLGSDYGGPLFFAHYSYLGLDPRNLQDQYANYWTQNVNHSLINHAYCRENPKNYVGYSNVCWGLTASDGHNGYSAHSPNNDRGVLTPTAAISSLPYTPDESMAAIRHFYYTLGDRLWGEYGFYDAFNPSEGWVAGSFLAIDQGPIICMIENYRSGLLWDLFMSAPEVRSGLDSLGFSY